MNILLCPDKFKGSLSAREVAEAVERGLRSAPLSSVHSRIHPLADGGDGSLLILNESLALNERTISVEDPLGRPVSAAYSFSETAAFVEVARAAGLALLSTDERSPLKASTYGVGQQIRAAMAEGAKECYLFLGGSATNDGGTGIATALGYRFLDAAGNELRGCGENLERIRRIRPPETPVTIDFTLLCDVTNPLIGPRGAARVYAKQKGATTGEIERLDRGMRHFAGVLAEHSGVETADIPGAGAAGGIAAGLVALLDARLRPGFTTIAELTVLDGALDWADFVITGEGRLDEQSLQGKVVGGVAEYCRERKLPFAVVAGAEILAERDRKSLGAERIDTIVSRSASTAEAMEKAAFYLEQIGSDLGHFLVHQKG